MVTRQTGSNAASTRVDSRPAGTGCRCRPRRRPGFSSRPVHHRAGLGHVRDSPASPRTFGERDAGSGLGTRTCGIRGRASRPCPFPPWRRTSSRRRPCSPWAVRPARCRCWRTARRGLGTGIRCRSDSPSCRALVWADPREGDEGRRPRTDDGEGSPGDRDQGYPADAGEGRVIADLDRRAGDRGRGGDVRARNATGRERRHGGEDGSALGRCVARWTSRWLRWTDRTQAGCEDARSVLDMRTFPEVLYVSWTSGDSPSASCRRRRRPCPSRDIPLGDGRSVPPGGVGVDKEDYTFSRDRGAARPRRYARSAIVTLPPSHPSSISASGVNDDCDAALACSAAQLSCRATSRMPCCIVGIDLGGRSVEWNARCPINTHTAAHV